MDHKTNVKDILGLLARLAVGGMFVYAGALKLLAPAEEFAYAIETYKVTGTQLSLWAAYPGWNFMPDYCWQPASSPGSMPLSAAPCCCSLRPCWPRPGCAPCRLHPAAVSVPAHQTRWNMSSSRTLFSWL